MRRHPPRGRLLVPATMLVALSGCVSNPPPPPPPTVPQACESTVQTAPLPPWARAGFTGDAAMAHVMGAGGQIVAALFGHPLAVSRPTGTNNKILWVAQSADGPGDLVIEAEHAGTGTRETRRVTGGPGPSIIDLPQPGCWRLSLTWPGHTDTMDLTYL